MYRKLSTVMVGLALCGCAVAQVYVPPTMGMPVPGTNTPAYTAAHKSYGMNKAAVGALIGGGAGAGILYMTKFRHPNIEGCVGPDGRTLVKDNGKRYAIVGDALRPGERVVVNTKKMKDDSGAPAIDILQLRKDLGRCEREAQNNPPSPPR